MFEQVKKGVMTGIGMGLLTNEKIKEFAKKSAEEANLTTEDARKLAEELIEQSDEAKQKLEEKIDLHIQKQFDKMGLASKKDIEELKMEIHKLQKENKRSTSQNKTTK